MSEIGNMSQMVGTGLIALVVVSIAAAVLGSVFGTSILLAAGESAEYPTIGSKLKRGLQLFTPMLFASLITLFLVYGGLGLFIIPGIIIAIMVSFTMYEIVFTSNRGTDAIRNSVTIISQNFGDLLIRVGVIILISIAINIVTGMISAGLGDDAGPGLASLVSLLIEPIFGLFTLAYYFEVYKEARSATDFNRSSSLTWMWIVSILGWVIGIMMISALSRVVGPQLQKALENEFGNVGTSPEMLMDDSQDFLDADSFLEQYGDEMTEEDKAAFRESLEKTEKMMQQDKEMIEQEN